MELKSESNQLTRPAVLAVDKQGSRRARPRGRWLAKQGRRVCTADFWLRRFPIIGFIRNYNAASLLSDVIAGITVGLTFIPAAMASSLVAGLPAKHGLYSSIVCFFVYTILGSRPDVSVGPNIVTALFCKPLVDKFGPGIAFTYCFYTGCAVTLIAVLNLGFLLEFISGPVLDGFLSAAAISAGTGQIPALLGMPRRGSNFVQFATNILKNVHEARLWDTVLGLSCIAMLVLLKLCQRYGVVSSRDELKKLTTKQTIIRGIFKYLSLSRTALVAILSTVIIANVTVDGSPPPVYIAGEIETGLPEFQFPSLTTEYNNQTLSVGETMIALSSGAPVTLIIVVLSNAAAKVFANGESVDSTQEMLAVGVSNILGSCVQSYPSTASVVRTMINKASGVVTPIGGGIGGIVIVVAVSFFTNTLKFFPTSALAAIVLCSVPQIIRIHKSSALFYKAKKSDLIPLHVTFWGCLFGGLDIGMIAGISSNILIILYETARPKLNITNEKVGGQNVLLVRADRAVTYPAAEYVKQRVTKHSLRASPNLHVVLDGTHVTTVDTTAVKVLLSLGKEVNIRKQKFYMWNWSKSTSKTFLKYDKNIKTYFCYEETIEEVIDVCNDDQECNNDAAETQEDLNDIVTATAL